MKKNKESKSIGKIILAVLLAVVVAVGVIGAIIGIKTAVEEKKYADSLNNITTEKIKLSKKEKVFSVNNFSITLTDDFKAYEDVEFNDNEIGCVANGIEFYVYPDSFEADSKESKMTAMEYVESITVDFDGNTKVSEYNGVPLVEYKFKGENDDVAKDYKVFCYKGEDCFWMVHFMVENHKSQFYKPYIFEWVETIEAK